MTVDGQLRRALVESAAAVPVTPDRWDDVVSQAAAMRSRRRRLRRRLRLTTLAVVAALGAGLLGERTEGATGY